jgi:membrane associated rhomboid family serine protease
MGVQAMRSSIGNSDEQRGPFPWATLSLVAVTCAAFGLELLHPGGVHGAMAQWGEAPRRIAGGGSVPGYVIPAWITMLTYMLMHSGWTHLGGNMLALALVGASLERRAGALRLLYVYIGSGFLASLASVLSQWHSEHTMSGASGAVAGVALGWLLLCPWTWRSGWLLAAPGWRGAGAWVETVLRAVVVLRALGSWVLWPLIVAACGAGWGVLAFRSNLTHLCGAFAGCILTLPFAILVWRGRVAPSQSRV